MTASDSSDTVKSFKELKRLLEKKAVPLPARPSESEKKAKDPDPAPGEERRLFLEAMADVRPMTGPYRIVGSPPIKPPEPIPDDPDTTAITKLKNLVNHGKGFVVAQTPEYIEGTGHRVPPVALERLHRGDYAIQAHIDLHGLDVESARSAFEGFLKQSISCGKRAVLIVHGRGLSSPAEPVLKTNLYRWLTCGPWRKWVLAFTSARLCDGGAGATYVLLRQRPLTKRFRKKPRLP